MTLTSAQREILERLYEGRALYYIPGSAHPFRWGWAQLAPAAPIRKLIKDELVVMEPGETQYSAQPIEMTEAGRKALAS